MREIARLELDAEDLIFEIRGKQVMLDSDLAKLYEVETKRINEAVKNNLEKFPGRFSFCITLDEYRNLKSKFSTSSWENHGGRRKLPRAFTEQGVAMLATILKSKTATKVSIQIMDAFVAMRKYIGTNLLEQKYINNQVMKNTEDIKTLQDSFAKFEEKKKTNEIYFNGQIYDAYSKIFDIFSEAKRELVIIDSYADKTLLDIIKRLKIDVIIIAKKNGYLTEQDIIKYNKQYHNLKIKYDTTFHDRFFILDGKATYHCGASINRIGHKTFAITRIEDKCLIEALVAKIGKS